MKMWIIIAVLVLGSVGFLFLTPGHNRPAYSSVSVATSAPTSSSTASSSPARGGKIIYFTFDMDMNELMYKKTITTGEKWYDPAVFAYLEQNHIPASFFVSGLFAVAYPDLMKSLASTSEFSFENHSYDEASFTPHCYWLTALGNDSAKAAQIEATERIIQSLTGQTPKYFRFPGICHDKASDALVESLGYTINDGTVVPSDPFNTDTRRMVRTVMSKARDGATIIMHVGGHNAPESLPLLEQIVPGLKAEGYAFEKL